LLPTLFVALLEQLWHQTIFFTPESPHNHLTSTYLGWVKEKTTEHFTRPPKNRRMAEACQSKGQISARHYLEKMQEQDKHTLDLP